MSKHGCACFTERPRRIEDLMRPHHAEEEREYEIVKTVVLSGIDYENFITDMLADRVFLEENAALCGAGGPVRCLLIWRRGRAGGVLAAPDGAHVKAAAVLEPGERAFC